jgi:hypothetical protein
VTWKHPRPDAGRRSRSARTLGGVAVVLLATGTGLAAVAEVVPPARAKGIDRSGTHAQVIAASSTATLPTTAAATAPVVTTAPVQTTSTVPVAPVPVVTSTTASPDTRTYEQAVGAQSLRLTAFDLNRLPGWTVVFLPGRVGYRGRTLAGPKRIEIYVRQGDTAQLVAYDLGHELGHAVDVTYSTPARRSSYRSIRGIQADTRWFGCADCTDFATPAGDFAETFGFMVTGPGFNWRSALGRPPTNDQIAAVTALYGL